MENIYDVENMSDDEAESKAHALGWRSKDEFSGDPEKYTDAKTFLNKANENIPMLRENYRKIDAQNQLFKEELERLKSQVSDTNKRLEDAERRGYEKAVKDIEEQQRLAALSGDLEKYDRLQEQKKALANVETQQQPQMPMTNQPIPLDDQIALAVFQNTNPWFIHDVELNADMSAYILSIKSRNPNLPMSEILEKAKARVVKSNPEKFGELKKTNEVLPTSGSTGKTSSYGELPERAAYDNVWNKMERSMRVKGMSETDIEKAKKTYQANCLNNK